jgi:hypothetical protein
LYDMIIPCIPVPCTSSGSREATAMSLSDTDGHRDDCNLAHHNSPDTLNESVVYLLFLIRASNICASPNW